MNTTAQIYIGDSRSMGQIKDAAIDLVVTSPPYWQIKDYGVPGQIGYGQNLHDYLEDLYHVWRECFRVLRQGARLCLNIGDQFARASVYGRYKVIPLHAEFINQCEQIGFDFMGAIIWQKKTTMNTSGGAVVMGSYPFPPNGIVEIDYEFIQIFKKPGPGKKVTKEVKEATRLTKEEWKEYFAGHWYFGGTRQAGHEAMFPEELPRRLIKMFTFQGDTVLDPFLGSGTTVKTALGLARNAVGYEINPDFLEEIPRKIGGRDRLPFYNEIQISRDHKKIEELPEIDYTPAIQNISFRSEKLGQRSNQGKLHKVTEILDELTIKLENGKKIRFLGIRIERPGEAIEYLRKRIFGKQVLLKEENTSDIGITSAYVFLKNKIFINAYLIKSGMASPDAAINHKLKKKFMQLGMKFQTDLHQN